MISWNPSGESKKYANDCGDGLEYYERYRVPVAAALWCDVPGNQIQLVLDQSTEVGKAIFKSLTVSCLEPKCRALHAAVEAGQLPVYREQGGACRDHVAPNRRYVSRAELKSWIAEQYPNQKPRMLFDDVERTAHRSIDADVFRSVKADLDAARGELDKARALAKDMTAERDALLGERDSLREMVDSRYSPGDRAETTYLNIIGGLLQLLLGKSASGTPQSVFKSQAAIICALVDHFGTRHGIAKRTLEDKFSEAKKSIAE